MYYGSYSKNLVIKDKIEKVVQITMRTGDMLIKKKQMKKY